MDTLIKEVQAALGVDVDGKAGPQTWGAIYKAILNRDYGGDFTGAGIKSDPQSEKHIGSLRPEVRTYARALMAKAAAVGIEIRVISGSRTYAEQNALYAKGRTAPGEIVTNAKGGESNHNFGIAFDIGVFEGPSYLDESPKYKTVGILGQELGLEWGGNWTSIVDEPHFQLRPTWAKQLVEKAMLAEFRKRVSANVDLFAV